MKIQLNDISLCQYTKMIKNLSSSNLYIGVKINDKIHLFKNEGVWGETIDGKSTIFPYLFSLEIDYNPIDNNAYFVYLYESIGSFRWGYMDKNYLCENKLKIFKLILEMIFDIDNILFYDKNTNR